MALIYILNKLKNNNKSNNKKHTYYLAMHLIYVLVYNSK
jgi:hypothetical protein